MRYVEDVEKGLMAIDTGDTILRFARAKYSGKLGQFVPDSVCVITEYQTWMTKRDAVTAAKRLGYPRHHVERLGTRWCCVWGIRHDLRDSYFLADYE